MAPKRPSPLEQPPAASSSEEEEASSEEASGSDESESEPEPSEQKKTTSEKKPESSAAKSDDSSSGETETDSSESDSDEDDTLANHRVNVKPISSLRMEEAAVTTPPPKAAKSSRSKPAAAASPAMAKSGTKRGGGESEVTEAKKARKKNGDETAAAAAEEDSKKSKLFQRIWCDEDEIIILKGMHEFKSKRGVDPYADMNGFHDFIKKSLNVEVSKTQMQDKIRRLKKKFENNVKKNKKPTKDHESKVFERSRKVWGGEEEEEDEDLAGLVTISSFVNGEHSKSNGKMKSSIQKENKRTSALMDAVLLASPQRDKKSEAAASVMSMLSEDKGFKEFGLSESLVKQGLEKMGEAKRAELEYRWCKLHLAEMELFARRSELMSDNARAIVDAFKKSDD